MKAQLRRVVASLVSCALVTTLMPYPAFARTATASPSEPTEEEELAVEIEDGGDSTDLSVLADEGVLPGESVDGQVSPDSGDEAASELVDEYDDADPAEQVSDSLTTTEGETSLNRDEALLTPEPSVQENETVPEEPSIGEALSAESESEPVYEPSSAATVTYQPVKPITFILGEVVWDDFYGSYHYRYLPCDGDKLTVNDGTKTKTYTYTTSNFQWKGPDGTYGNGVSVDVYANLTRDQNTLGSHTLTVSAYSSSEWNLSSYTGTVDFQLVEPTLKSITYTPKYPIVLTYGVDSSKYYEYDQTTKTGHTYHHYFFPTGTRLLGDMLTLTQDVGEKEETKTYVYSSFKNPKYGYDDLGYVNAEDPYDIIYLDDLTITSEQPYAKRWGMGAHVFTINYKGRSTQVPVTVKADTIAKIVYAPKTAVRRSTAAAIAYTQKMGIYDASYAKRVTKYQIVFSAYQPVTGDALKVTAGEVTTNYIYDADKEAFVSSSESIPLRDVVFSSTTVSIATKKVTLGCSYRGKQYAIPVTVVKAAQKVSAKKKQVVVGKKCKVNAKTTGFAESAFTYKSTNPKVARVSKKGVIVGRSCGYAKIIVRARANAAFKASKAKVIKVKVGKANPMTVKAKKRASIKRAKSLKVVSVKKAVGKVTFINASSNATARKFKVNRRTGKVKVPKRIKRGTYRLKIEVRAAGKGIYFSKAKTVTIKVRVR